MDFDAKELKRAIRYRHRDQRAVIIEELRTACGFANGAERYIQTRTGYGLILI